MFLDSVRDDINIVVKLIAAHDALSAADDDVDAKAVTELEYAIDRRLAHLAELHIEYHAAAILPSRDAHRGQDASLDLVVVDLRLAKLDDYRAALPGKRSTNTV